MKKFTIVFALLFFAFSAHAQLVYEALPQNPSKKVLSFNGPALFDGPLGTPNNQYKYHTTWYGDGHIWTYKLPTQYGLIDVFFEMSLNGLSIGMGWTHPVIPFSTLAFGVRGGGNSIIRNNIAAADIYCYGNFYNVSDMTTKTNIAPVSGALKTILALKPVTYKWADPSMNRSTRATANPKEIGFIAQEVEKVIPDIVAIDDKDQRLINYQAIIPLLTAAIQELTARIEVLESQIKAK